MPSALLADIDGVLISNGRLDSVSSELRSLIQKLRDQGLLFTLTSGRTYEEQLRLHSTVITHPHPQEAILYQGCGVKLFGSPDHHLLGGFQEEQRLSLETFVQAHQELFSRLVPSPSNASSPAILAYFTPPFLEHRATDEAALRESYHPIKAAVEQEFPDIQVVRSADAVDLTIRGLTKAGPVRKYSELSGIPLYKMTAIGDAWNDWEMLKLIAEEGGRAIYVGTDEELEGEMRKLPASISQARGPAGTQEVLTNLLRER